MVPACSSDTLTNVLPHRNAIATDTGHDIPPRHSVQTQGRPVIVLSIDVKRHTGIHNTHFNVLGKTRPGNPYPTFHTQQRTLNSMMLILL